MTGSVCVPLLGFAAFFFAAFVSFAFFFAFSFFFSFSFFFFFRLASCCARFPLLPPPMSSADASSAGGACAPRFEPNVAYIWVPRAPVNGPCGGPWGPKGLCKWPIRGPMRSQGPP
jgi:hypothetical protein